MGSSEMDLRRCRDISSVMGLLASVTDPYAGRKSQMVVVLTAGIPFLDGVVVSYQTYLDSVSPNL